MESKLVKRLKKMRNLIRNNVAMNKAKLQQEIDLNEEEIALREKATKNPKLKKKLEKFLQEKPQRLQSIYAKKARENTVLTDMTTAEIEEANKDGNMLISDTRLKSYNM